MADWVIKWQSVQSSVTSRRPLRILVSDERRALHARQDLHGEIIKYAANVNTVQFKEVFIWALIQVGLGLTLIDDNKHDVWCSYEHYDPKIPLAEPRSHKKISLNWEVLLLADRNVLWNNKNTNTSKKNPCTKIS